MAERGPMAERGSMAERGPMVERGPVSGALPSSSAEIRWWSQDRARPDPEQINMRLIIITP
jgi:hypothetical protein